MSASPAEQDLDALAVGSEIVRARTELGMTQSQLSEESGVSRSAIKGYETGRNMPGSRELKAICRVLKVTPNALLFGTELPFEKPSKSAGLETAARLLSMEGADRKKATMRLAFLSDLLAAEEVVAMLTLVEGLALARHGPELVKRHMSAADVMAGIGEGMRQALANPLRGGAVLTSQEITKIMEEAIDRPMKLGHGSAE